MIKLLGSLPHVLRVTQKLLSSDSFPRCGGVFAEGPTSILCFERMLFCSLEGLI